MATTLSEVLTPEEALQKFPEYVRDIYEFEQNNTPYEPLVMAYHYFSPDEETWDMEQWMLVFSSGYGTGVHIVDIWRNAKAKPDINSFCINNKMWEKMREVA